MALKHTGRIIFTGYVNNEELYKYQQIADIQVIPSLCEEAAGLVAIEGMCAGLPLIVTRSGGLVEYVNEKCAMIVSKEAVVQNLMDAIVQAGTDIKWRMRASRESLLQAEKFTEDKFYKNLVSLVSKISS